MKTILTHQLLHSAASDNGGWNKAQLNLLGIQWPPQKVASSKGMAAWISRQRDPAIHMATGHDDSRQETEAAEEDAARTHTTKPIMKSITIQIDPDGKVKLEGVGFHGKECDEKMAAFERELGSVTKRVNSPTYHQPVSNAAKQKAGA